jgi:hypothetical protein
MLCVLIEMILMLNNYWVLIVLLILIVYFHVLVVISLMDISYGFEGGIIWKLYISFVKLHLSFDFLLLLLLLSFIMPSCKDLLSFE